MVLNGRYSQVKGSFQAGVDLLAPGGAIDLKTPEITRPTIYKIGIIAEPGTKVQINDVEVQISKFGVLELDEVLNIRKLVFPQGADAFIDFVY